MKGIEVKGWPVSTMVRGKTVVRDGALAGDTSIGQHVSRALSPRAAPAGTGARAPSA